ncbi:MAG: SEC-C metal-binding domain-containing protein [bacterium]|nr:SEC-C metal-binding domain-containing protein [bacterium]
MSGGPRRNDPCPCGSGRKYKRCHLAEDEAGRGARTRAERLGTLGADLTNAICAYAHERFGERWDDPAFEIFFEPEDAFQLLVPYSAHHVPIEGRTAAEWFREAFEPELSADERACLDAEAASWLSLWQVIDGRPGDGLTLRDRLTGQVRDVIERTASRTLKEGESVLARLVELGDFVSINGLYPVALPETEAAEIERRTRAHLRRKRDVRVERLREPKTMRYLIRRVDEACEARLAGPTLVNNDGDPILFTTDHFEFETGADGEIARRLAALGGARDHEPGDDEDGADASEVFDFVGRGEVLVGQARVGDRRLRVDTNSVERADTLRGRIERSCGSLLRHLVREHGDPLSAAAVGGGSAEDQRDDEPSPERHALARAIKEQHYAEWLDVPVPALRGETPRGAVSTEDGRARVEALLADVERAEMSLPANERFDFGRLRRELGLGE